MEASVPRAALNRRTLLRLVASALVALVTLPARKLFAKKLAIPLTKLPSLAKVDGSMLVRIKGTDVILVRDTETSIRAFSPVCTHQKCLVHYTPATHHFDCQCHASSYNLEGKVIGGPAPKPLTRFPSAIEDERLVLDLPEPTP